MKKTCGFVKSFKGGVAYALYPTGNVNIKWDNVSEQFQIDFNLCWKEADNLMNQEHDENVGANIMCLLDLVGFMINNNEIVGKTFEQAYELACEESLAELNK